MLTRSVGKFFVLKIDLVYFDLVALFKSQGLLSLNRLTGSDNSNNQWLYGFKSQKHWCYWDFYTLMLVYITPFLFSYPFPFITPSFYSVFDLSSRQKMNYERMSAEIPTLYRLSRESKGSYVFLSFSITPQSSILWRELILHQRPTSLMVFWAGSATIPLEKWLKFVLSGVQSFRPISTLPKSIVRLCALPSDHRC